MENIINIAKLLAKDCDEIYGKTLEMLRDAPTDVVRKVEQAIANNNTDKNLFLAVTSEGVYRTFFIEDIMYIENAEGGIKVTLFPGNNFILTRESSKLLFKRLF